MISIEQHPINSKKKTKAFLLSLTFILSLSQSVLAQERTGTPSSQLNGSQPTVPSIEKRKEQEKIEKLIREKRYPQAYKLADRLQKRYPDDLNAIYLLAYIDLKVHFLRKGILTLQKGLKLDPENVDLSILKAEILIKQGHLKKARKILKHFQKSNPNNKTIQQDLLKTYFPGGYQANIPVMDQHLFSLGLIQTPFVPDSSLVSTLPSWSLNFSALGINYSGGAVFLGDAQLESPIADDLRFIAGRTEYLGFSTGQGSATNSWTYAGVDARINDHTDIQVDAGDTSIGRAGIYGHLFYNPGVLTVDIQGVNNMIWGDFGQAIQSNGSESGVTAFASLQLTRRFSVGANYWYYDYSLNNGSLPYGNLHNTFGYMDYQFTEDPEFDLLVGYDDWTIMADSPAVAALVPEIMRQQYVLVALNGMKQYENGLMLNGQIGGYDDFYNQIASYEGALGIRYPVSMHWSFYANAVYFNASTLYSGPSEELMLGVNFLF
ncbi:MAG: tetratricopeptide repeat protein [Leptospirales bacterium]